MGRLRSGSGLQRTWLVAAALALVVRLIVPAGFMLAPAKSFQLIVCTGHGTALFQPVGQGPTKAPKTEDHVCIFSGAHLATDAVSLGFIPVKTSWVQITVPILKASLSPGRGLAAPPPPATASPNTFS